MLCRSGPRKSRKHTGSSSVLRSTLPFSYLLGVHARVLSQAMSWGSSWAGGYKFLSPVEAWWGDLALVAMGIASDLQECAPHQRNTKVHASNCYGAAARSKSTGEREPSRSKEYSLLKVLYWNSEGSRSPPDLFLAAVLHESHV